MGVALCLIAVVLWGLIQIPIKLAKTPARVGLAISLPAALVASALIVLVKGDLCVPELAARDWYFIALMGVLHFSLASFGYLEAVQRAGITTAAPITRFTPLIVVLLHAAISRTPLSPWLTTAAVLVLAGGVLCTRGARQLHPVEHYGNLRLGMFLAVFACFMWSGGYLAVGEISEDIPRSLVTLYGLAFGAVVYWIIVLASGRAKALRRVSRRDVALYVTHGIASYALAYWALFEGIALLGLGQATVIAECWPAAAVVVGIAVFREPMNLQKFLGTLVMIGSAILVIVLS